ncbi:MAG: hypothetical protein MUO67_02900, partial [Anaerolineales bacterium]|nr:hypothetical protein [Anaerolineales bacterium]
ADDNILQAVTGQSPRLMGASSVLASVSLLNGEDVDFYHIVPNAFYSREDPEAIQLYLAEY